MNKYTNKQGSSTLLIGSLNNLNPITMMQKETESKSAKVNIFLNRIFATLCSLLLSTSAMASHPTTVYPGTAFCNKGPFSEYLASFTESEEVQRLSTKNPLPVQHIDSTAEPEPKPVIKLYKAKQLTFPLIPREIDREKQQLKLRIDKQADKKAKATLYREDSGYSVSFLFQRRKCWSLQKIEDDSL